METRELLKRLYGSSESANTLVFTHADKVWVIPNCAVEGAMDMYQPASRGGKMLKKNFIKKHKAPFYARGSKVEKINLELNKDIKKQLEELLGISDFYVAAYMGDTSTSQNDKAVLQIYSDSEIYAYVKVTTNKENAKRFEREAKALNQLHDAGIECVPRVIGLDLDSEIKMFAQVNEKPMGQEARLEFSEQILETTKDIVEKTKKSIDYKESDFCESVDFVKTQMDLFDKEQQSIIKNAIGIVEIADLTFAFSHGDFTPWNIYYVKDEIRLFDLEYCSNSMPAYIDIFHYLSQMMLLGNRYTAQCVMREYEHQLELISIYVDDPKTTFICYLVWIISFYIKRTNDIESVREKLDVWVEIIEYLIKYLK